MSFLQEVQKKLNQLQSTNTVVTLPTGERFLESRSAATSVQLEKLPFGFVDDTKPDKIPAEILNDFLYLGSQDAVSAENIINYRFTHILSLGVTAPSNELSSQVNYKFLSLLDLPDTQLFENGVCDEAFAFINSAREIEGRILVHCNAGVSRAASIVIAFLIAYENFTYDAAYDLVKLKRPAIQPNTGFIQQLKKFSHQEQISKKFS